MSSHVDNVRQEADQLYRKIYGKMVAFLLSFSSSIDIEEAEDIVQESFVIALDNWRVKGLPGNPAGWIFTVCKNNALNRVRLKGRTGPFTGNEVETPTSFEFSEAIPDDQQLKFLFACAHPDLSPKVQVIITLKYIVNLKVEAIASVFGMTIDGVDKLLLRARQKIRDEKILFKFPGTAEIKSRLSIVHKIIYLLFNEGYKSSAGKDIIREELCEEALLMCRELINSSIANQDSRALYALMLFNAARIRSRFGEDGELRDLEEQDRSLWNKDLIALGCSFMNQDRDNFSSYRIEAAIAYLHCSSNSFHVTDWESITQLYERLLKINPNPFVQLNYAIASYYSQKKERAFSLLQELSQLNFFGNYYLLNATKGKFSFLEKDYRAARKYYLTTLGQTDFSSEKKLIQKRLDTIDRLLGNKSG